MKLLIEMNLSPRWVKTLADAGVEAEHWSSFGEATATDSAIMGFARAHGYVLLTHNLDFGSILAAIQGEKPSVVQIRSEDVSPEGVGKAGIDTLGQCPIRPLWSSQQEFCSRLGGSGRPRLHRPGAAGISRAKPLAS